MMLDQGIVAVCTVLDGYSRFIVHRDIRERMTTKEVEIIVQRARERFPGARPRVISDNGPQFIWATTTRRQGPWKPFLTWEATRPAASSSCMPAPERN